MRLTDRQLRALSRLASIKKPLSLADFVNKTGAGTLRSLEDHGYVTVQVTLTGRGLAVVKAMGFDNLGPSREPLKAPTPLRKIAEEKPRRAAVIAFARQNTGRKVA